MNKRKKILIITLSIFILIFFVLEFIPRDYNYNYDNVFMKETEMPILIAHGGGNQEFPDNTLEAFYNAYSIDERVIMETDVNLTKDGVAILSHDITLDRKTNVTGYIGSWTYEELLSQKVDFGYENPVEDRKLSGERRKYTNYEGVEVTPLDVKYPAGVSPRDDKVFLVTTLEELLIAFPNNKISIEIKPNGSTGIELLNIVVELVQKHNAFDRIVFGSFHVEVFKEIQKLKEDNVIPKTTMVSPEVYSFIKFYCLYILNLDFLYKDEIAVLQIPAEEAIFFTGTKSLIKTAHKKNIAVQYWTVNNEKQMKKLIKNGADGIMTDYPHLLKEVYNSYNK